MPPKAYYASDLLGTMLGLYRVRNTTLKDNSGVLEIRNLDDTEFNSVHTESSLVEDSLNSKEISTTVTPGTGRRKLIAKNDGWYDVDDEGVVTKVGTGTGGGGMENHGNEYHTSTFITAADLPLTYVPTSHGNEAHTSAFITASDLPAPYELESHGNEAHTSSFITVSDLPTTYAPSSHGNEAHTSTFITSADLPASLPPDSHGNEAHSSTFITASDIPSIPDPQIQSDWNQDNNLLLDYIKNKPSTMNPTSHGNEAHSSTFITADDIPSSLPPDSHGNEAHSSTFITVADLPATYAPSSHGNEAHSSTFITSADLPSTYTPSDHAGDHVTGGGDVIADVIAAGNSGLMSGSDKTKLDGIASGAEVNVQSDWNQATNTADDYIKNKPTIPAAQVNSDWNATGTIAEILNKPSTMTPASHGNEAHSSIFITSADLPATYAPSSHGNEAHSSTFITAADVHSNSNDPSSDEKAALAGTSGTPSVTNKYVTNDDSRNTNARTPSSHGNEAHSSTFITAADIPPIPDPQIQSDWEQENNLLPDYIKNKPTIAPQVQADWTQADSGSLDYIKNKPTIPAAQVNSDWTASGTVAEILNKPSTMTPSSHGNEAHSSTFITAADIPDVSSVKETITQVSHTFVAENAIRQGLSAFELAKADAASTADVYGVVESVDGNDFVVVLEGLITGLSGGTKGADGFLSAETAGAIVTEDPSLTDPTCVSKPILKYTGTTTARVQIQRGALQGPEVPDESITNVRLVINDSETVQLIGVPGTDKAITVNGETIDMSVGKTITTNSASHFIISGTTTVSKSTALSSYTGNGSDGNAYNAHGLFHVYVCNSNACWNFDSYDRRGSIILSPNAPVSRYLASSGDGLNARHVGWIILNSSRLIAYNTYLASRFNPIPTIGRVNASTDITDLDGDADPPDWRDTDAIIYAIHPESRRLSAEIQVNMNNAHAEYTSLGHSIWFDSTEKNTGAFWAFQSAGYLAGDVRHLHHSEVATATVVRQVKLRVYAGYGASGYPGDPSFWATLSYVQATIEE